MNKKIALVIGGSGGVGSEIIKSLIQEKFKVCTTYHRNNKKIEEMKKLHKNDFTAYPTDLCSEISIKKTFQQISKENNALDAIIFSISSQLKYKNILNLGWEDFEEHLNTQTKGLFYVLDNLKDQIKNKHKTKFIIILSESCIGKPPSGFAPYVSAKYFLMGFSKSMAVDLSKYNCTVNMISPGMIDTNLISSFPQKLVELTAEKNLLKRIATPKDVANVVVFLSKDDSDYLNGVNITVNGGSVML